MELYCDTVEDDADSLRGTSRAFFRRRLFDKEIAAQPFCLYLHPLAASVLNEPLVPPPAQQGLEKLPALLVSTTSDPDGSEHSIFSSCFVFTSQDKKEQPVILLWINFWSKFCTGTTYKRQGCRCSPMLISLWMSEPSESSTCRVPRSGIQGLPGRARDDVDIEKFSSEPPRCHFHFKSLCTHWRTEKEITPKLRLPKNWHLKWAGN